MVPRTHRIPRQTREQTREQTGARPFVSTVGRPEEPGFDGHMVPAPAVVADPFRDLAHLWRATRDADAVLLRGSVSFREHYRDLLFAALLKLRRERPQVFISDATWEQGSASLAARWHLPSWLQRRVAVAAIRAIDGPHVTYGVLARDERQSFAEAWDVPIERTVFTAFPMTLYTEWDTPTSDEGFVFSGGNSLRDYQLLLDAADGLDVPVRIASSWRPADARVPENVELSPTSHAEFVSLMARSHAVVVPLRPAVRSAGQQSYLNAMVLGKPVLVTDSLGVRDYVEDGVTGVVVEPTPEAMRAAIRHVMDPANADFYAAMGRRAREHALQHATLDAYYRTITEAMGYPCEGPLPSWPDREAALRRLRGQVAGSEPATGAAG